MTDVFLKVLSMSLTASYCVVFICIARILLRRAPRIFSYLLWSVVAVRLLLPVSLETSFSLMGRGLNVFVDQVAEGSFVEIFGGWEEAESESGGQRPLVSHAVEHAEAEGNDPGGIQTQPLSVQAQAGTQAQSSAADQVQPQVINDKDSAESTVEAEVAQTAPAGPKSSRGYDTMLRIASYVWLAGMVALFGYCIMSYVWLSIRLNRKSYYAYDYKWRHVYRVRGLETPFVLGLVRPSIYIPEELIGQEAKQCLAHEYTHIRRKDYLVKQFAFLLSCVYWFQPLIWLAYFLMVRDMEMSCDEATLRRTDLEGRKVYSATLVRFAGSAGRFVGCPLAFGENSTARRVKNILKLRKHAAWALALAGVLAVACAAGLMTDPVQLQENLSKRLSAGELYGLSSSRDTSSYTKALMAADAQGKVSGEREMSFAELQEAIVAASMGYKTVDLSLWRESPNKVAGNDFIDIRYHLYAQVTAQSTAVRSAPKEDAEAWNTLQEGTVVELIAFGDALRWEGLLYVDRSFQEEFLSDPDIMEECRDYALVRYQFVDGDSYNYYGRSAPLIVPDRVGYVRLDDLGLFDEFNEPDGYRYWIGRTWTEAFSHQDGETLYQMAADKSAFSRWAYVNGITAADPAQADLDTEASWPWDLYYFSLAERGGNEVNIQYFIQTDGAVSQVWRQDLEILPTDEELENMSSIRELLDGTVRFSQVRIYEQIDSYNDFADAYLSMHGIPNYLYLEAERVGKLHRVNQEAAFQSPETAAVEYMNLAGGTAEVLKYTDSSYLQWYMEEARPEAVSPLPHKSVEMPDPIAIRYVKYTFAETDSSGINYVYIPVYQEDGYWNVDVSMMGFATDDWHMEMVETIVRGYD